MKTKARVLLVITSLMTAAVLVKASVSAGEKSCTYNGTTHSHGSVVCQNGYEYRCNDGSWDALNTKCK